MTSHRLGPRFDNHRFTFHICPNLAGKKPCGSHTLELLVTFLNPTTSNITVVNCYKHNNVVSAVLSKHLQ